MARNKHLLLWSSLLSLGLLAVAAYQENVQREWRRIQRATRSAAGPLDAKGARVLVIGGGVVGLHSAKMAAGLGADVTILDRSLHRMAYLDEIFGGRVKTRFSTFDALDEETRGEIENLVCEHSLMYSGGSLGFLDYSEEEKRMFKPVRQRLVRTHPVTGRRSLYLSSHAGAILGMPMPEARMLLRDLTGSTRRYFGEQVVSYSQKSGVQSHEVRR